MHPDLLGTLARQRDRNLRCPAELPDLRDPWPPDLSARDALRRARARVGAALVDVGVHLVATT